MSTSVTLNGLFIYRVRAGIWLAVENGDFDVIAVWVVSVDWRIFHPEAHAFRIEHRIFGNLFNSC